MNFYRKMVTAVVIVMVATIALPMTVDKEKKEKILGKKGEILEIIEVKEEPIAKGVNNLHLLVNSYDTELEKEYVSHIPVLKEARKEEQPPKPVAVSLEEKEEEPKKKEGQVYEDITVSFYCPCKKCCGPNATGTTASGKKVWTGMEDPNYIAINWLPQGTKVELTLFPGRVFTNVDTGGHSRLQKTGVDVFSPLPHDDVYALGLQKTELIVISEGW